MLERLHQTAKEDVTYKKLADLVREGTIRRYWLENDLLYVKGVESTCQKGSCKNP
jgi:hypothetical protein